MSFPERSPFKSSILLLPVLFLLSANPLTSQADIFTTDLEGYRQTNPILTTTVTVCTLCADFRGGAIDFLGLGSLYNSGSAVNNWFAFVLAGLIIMSRRKQPKVTP